MFWNVENAFDIFDDPDTDDDDFLPQGRMRWNRQRYWKKINDIYKTIIAAGEWSPPDLVAFCEVENRRVLDDLVKNTNLSRYDYEIIHEDSPDERGIDVCLIYRKERVNLISHEYIVPDGVNRSDLGSRTILYAGFQAVHDTIHLFFNHWPSKKGGVLAGADLRMQIASTVGRKADSILSSKEGRAKIIIAGDFNCTPGDREINVITTNAVHHFVNLTQSEGNGEKGTYRFRGIWEILDQVIVSEYFIKSKEGLSVNRKSVRIFDPDFLLTNDPNYPGLSPYSMYRGLRYQGGVSDHLPLVVDCWVPNQVLQDEVPIPSPF